MSEMDEAEGPLYKKRPVVVTKLNNQLIKVTAYIYDLEGTGNQIEPRTNGRILRKNKRGHAFTFRVS